MEREPQMAAARAARDETRGRPFVAPRRVREPAMAAPRGYQHEALFYAGEDDLTARVLPFVRGAIAQREPILVVLLASKVAALRDVLGDDAAAVHFEDMERVGTNPARIIPLWTQFVEDRRGNSQRLRGIGEPIWAGRAPAALVECQRHEQLLNLVFEEVEFTLLCPYDVTSLPDEVLSEAERAHPLVSSDGRRGPSASYPGAAAFSAPFSAPIPGAPDGAVRRSVTVSTLTGARQAVRIFATAAGLSIERVEDLVLAVNEVATNGISHGGGSADLAMWREPDVVVCELIDRGTIANPLAGRQWPGIGAYRGRGLWITNQLCDLVQIRDLGPGTVVRLHMRTT